jgi:anti-sigma regulatory factor (Ser/Thr protein kinase)
MGYHMTIRETILRLAARPRIFKTADIVRALGRPISRQYVSKTLAGMVRDGQLVKAGSTRGAVYAGLRHAAKLIASAPQVTRRLTNVALQEDRVLSDLKDSAPFLKRLPANVGAIVSYAFLEMMNNAIEHSGSRRVEVEVARTNGDITFVVNDFGVGVFHKIMRERKLGSDLEAIQDLLKGKTTTQPEAHSGQGIFFTSKVGDVFVLESFRRRLRVDNRIGDYFIEPTDRLKKGTRVFFSISATSPRRLEDVFRSYSTDASEPAFDKSEVKVRLFTLGGGYVSRSEARRMLAGLDKFRSVILDFDRVAVIGQAFADEVFRVFRRQHPHITVIPTNMNDTVRFMVDRAREAGSTAQGREAS